jgi:hypothetical protein
MDKVYSVVQFDSDIIDSSPYFLAMFSEVSRASFLLDTNSNNNSLFDLPRSSLFVPLILGRNPC